MTRLCVVVFSILLVRASGSWTGSTPKALREAKQEDNSGRLGHRRRPLLELMSMNLDTWGAHAGNSTVNSPQGISTPHRKDFRKLLQPNIAADGEPFNPLAQVPEVLNMFDARTVSMHPLLSFSQYARTSSSVFGNVVFVIGICGMLVIAAYIISCLWCDGSESDDEFEKASKDGRPAGAALAKLGQSTWAQAYADAPPDQKESFELLFRCNMISTEEFSLQVVSQEHIQECTWIATHMLQHKPMEEWVGLWQQAQQSFEDRVADCFEASAGGPPASGGLGARALAQRLTATRSGQLRPATPTSPASRPSSANLDYMSEQLRMDMRPVHS